MLTASLLASVAGAVHAQTFLLLGAPFGEHMVLQQGAPIPIWGSGCPGGDTVRAWLNGQSRTGQCDWKGDWIVEFAPMAPGGPYQLLMEIGGYGPLIPSSAANSRGGVELNDVLIGEVVLADVSSGPTLGEANDAGKDIAAAKLPWIRMLNSSGRWTAVSPAAAGGFSANAFYLARTLYNRLKIPVGVIDRPDGALCTPLQARFAPTYCAASVERLLPPSRLFFSNYMNHARNMLPGADQSPTTSASTE
jgi:sialate O-acetylesterase